MLSKIYSIISSTHVIRSALQIFFSRSPILHNLHQFGREDRLVLGQQGLRLDISVLNTWCFL